MKLRVPILLFIISILLLMLSPLGRSQVQTCIQYNVQINPDGSAAWTITQVSTINGTVDTWADFQQKVTDLVNASMNQTHRPMAVDNTNYQMSTTINSGDSKTAEYAFKWLNFSSVNKNQLTAGDVFNLTGFFNLLYGDGELDLIYPQNYTVTSVSPLPDAESNGTQTLQWLGTQFFAAEQPNIIFTRQTSVTVNPDQPPYLLISSALALTVAAIVMGRFFVSHQRQKQKIIGIATIPVRNNVVETEEEKVIKLLQSKGGSMYQADITEECKFSKAKTSLLLSTLEKKGRVRRVKKGRDKIVNIIHR